MAIDTLQEISKDVDKLMEDLVDPSTLSVEFEKDVDKREAFLSIRRDLVSLSKDPQEMKIIVVMLSGTETISDIISLLREEKRWSVEEAVAFCVHRCFSGFETKKVDDMGVRYSNTLQVTHAMYLMKFFEFI